MKERDVIRAAEPPEPRRGSTAEMVDRIKANIANEKIEVKLKEPPRGR